MWRFHFDQKTDADLAGLKAENLARRQQIASLSAQLSSQRERRIPASANDPNSGQESTKDRFIRFAYEFFALVHKSANADSNAVEGLSFNLRKSDSVLHPFVGYISWKEFLNYPSGPPISFELTFALDQRDEWELIGVKKKFESGEEQELAPSSSTFPDTVREAQDK